MRLVKLVFTIVFTLIITGCAGSEKAELRKTIQNYNTNLTMALKGMNPDLLKEVATERERGAVEIFIVQLADENRIMDSRLISINFKEFSINKEQKEQTEKENPVQTATVKTEELWSFRYLDVKTRNPVEGPKKIRYDAVYTLEKHDGKWLVADIKFQEQLLK